VNILEILCDNNSKTPFLHHDADFNLRVEFSRTLGDKKHCCLLKWGRKTKMCRRPGIIYLQKKNIWGLEKREVMFSKFYTDRFGFARNLKFVFVTYSRVTKNVYAHRFENYIKLE
jgi:hypothetical protein